MIFLIFSDFLEGIELSSGQLKGFLLVVWLLSIFLIFIYHSKLFQVQSKKVNDLVKEIQKYNVQIVESLPEFSPKDQYETQIAILNTSVSIGKSKADMTSIFKNLLVPFLGLLLLSISAFSPKVSELLDTKQVHVNGTIYVPGQQLPSLDSVLVRVYFLVDSMGHAVKKPYESFCLAENGQFSAIFPATRKINKLAVVAEKDGYLNSIELEQALVDQRATFVIKMKKE